MKFSCQIYNFPRLHQFDEFKDVGSYEFWFLNWIGGIVYEDGKFLSDFYFINKQTPDDDFKGQLNGKTISIRIDVSFYTYLNVGCIFCSKGYLKDRAPYNNKNQINTINIAFRKFHKPLKYKLVLEPDLNFPTQIEIQNCTYYIIEYKVSDHHLKVFIPEFVLCSYMFFRNTFVTEGLLHSTLNDCFDLSNLEKVTLNNGKSAIKVLYDNRMILPQEAHSIAQFFNIQNGINALNSINSNLIKGLTDPAEIYSQAYISVDLQFMEKIEMELTGKFLVNNAKQKEFLVYEISNLKFHCDRKTNESNILLEPMYKDEYNYQKIVATRYYHNSQTDRIRSRNYYSPHRPVLYTGVDVYVNQYKALKYDSFMQLNSFYSYQSQNIYKNRLRSELSREMVMGFESLGVKALVLAYKSEDGVLTKLNVANSEYLLIIYELKFARYNIYYVELSDESLLTIHSYSKSRISLIDIVLVLENLIFNFGLEENKYRSFTDFDKENYEVKFRVSINFHYSLSRFRIYLSKHSIPVFVNEINKIIKKLANV